MALSKALCLVILAAAASPSGAEEIARDTAAQHHAWARKFTINGSTAVPSREVSWPPAPIGPLAASPRVEEPERCARSELVFDRQPLRHWRAGDCT